MSNPTPNDFNAEKVLGQTMSNPVHAIKETSNILATNGTAFGEWFFGIIIIFVALLIIISVAFLFFSIIKRK